MTAKDMFWQCGYMEIPNDEDYPYITYNCVIKDEKRDGCYYMQDITFDLNDETIIFNIDDNELAFELNVLELQCIMKKIEELGWKKYEFRQGN